MDTSPTYNWLACQINMSLFILPIVSFYHAEAIRSNNTVEMLLLSIQFKTKMFIAQLF